MDEGNINEFLDAIESQYTVYDKMFMFSPDDFLKYTELFDKECEIPDNDIPITVLDMLSVKEL
jgi:hypothetical protein